MRQFMRPPEAGTVEGQCAHCGEWFPRDELSSLTVRVWPSEAEKLRMAKAGTPWNGQHKDVRLRQCEPCTRTTIGRQWDQARHQRSVDVVADGDAA